MVSKLLKLITSYYAGYIGGWFIVFTILAIVGALLTACTII